MKSIIVRAFALCLVCAHASVAIGKPPAPIDAAGLARLGDIRVVVVSRPLRMQRAQEFEEEKDYQDDLAEATGTKLDNNAVQQRSDDQRFNGGAFAFLFVSMGLGIFGGIADSAHEKTLIETTSRPTRTRMSAQRQAAKLDAKLAQAVVDALRARGLKTVGATAELFEAPKLAVHARGEVNHWLKKNMGDDPRTVLFVGFEQGAPISLTGAYGMAHLWLWTPKGTTWTPSSKEEKKSTVGPELSEFEKRAEDAKRADYATHYADGTKRRTPLVAVEKAALASEEDSERVSEPGKPQSKRKLYSFGRKAMFATPVPLKDLLWPPETLVAERKAEIETIYAPLLESPDRDVRRMMRVDRKIQLEKAEKWSPLGRTEYLVDAWNAPPDDAYARLVGPAQEELAQRIAAAVIAAD